MRKRKSEIKRYQLAERGIKTKVVREAEALYHVSRSQMAGLLGISEKTYYTLIGQDKLDRDRSDRFLFIEKIFEEGEHTFGSRDHFRGWLDRPHPNLAKEKPLKLMESLTGAEAVYAEILRTRHNVLS